MSNFVGEAPLRVSFNASCSSDPDGSIVNYTWDMGDGTTRTGSSFSHTYVNGGLYNVQLSVRDDDGLTGGNFEWATVLGCDGEGFLVTEGAPEDKDTGSAKNIEPPCFDFP